MNPLLKHLTAFALCGACSGGALDDEASIVSPAPVTTSAAEAGGAAGESAAPLPLTEEELERLLDALEQEMARRK